MSSSGILNDFKGLSDKTINWNSGERGHNSCEESSRETVILKQCFKPLAKKRRT